MFQRCSINGLLSVTTMLAIQPHDLYFSGQQLRGVSTDYLYLLPLLLSYFYLGLKYNEVALTCYDHYCYNNNDDNDDDNDNINKNFINNEDNDIHNNSILKS